MIPAANAEVEKFGSDSKQINIFHLQHLNNS